MSIRDNSFHDRRAAANTARDALIAKFKARPASDSPEILARKAERARIVAEREKRTAEREQAKRDEAERAQRDQIAQAAALEEAANAAQRAKEESAQTLRKQMLEYEAALKSKRDARYAARKARRN